ncbi:NAD(P)/FAD-dependent oxidoreductase [Leptospira sp. GIMC2001]|uniref:NAD(P)/FAD-dependent oxidoreductase n=1 Tax=Leptospira sp. GIMC2001 TaxID=1513297 RepID=UPI00234B0C7E|nr:FAD-dependent oxidoreductase [Leptospira sp. GIMC2001]WCL51193.1 FAD-dependent oxidoreductase [Leptospira sp. GIMC2001]
MVSVVVGSGIIGSWIALQLAEANEEVYVFEKSENAGDGISGRNSGVLHSGIYYDSNSLKSKFCLRGYDLAIPFFQNHNVPFSVCGKVITSGLGETKQAEQDKELEIEKLLENGRNLDIRDIEIKRNPGNIWKHVEGTLALWIPKTGVVDVSSYLKALWKACEDKGVFFLKNKKISVDKGQVYSIDSTTQKREDIQADHFINACGLHSDDLIEQSGQFGYEIRPNKGEYFRLKKTLPYQTLIYPLPMKNSTALGVHYTFHLGGEAYAGPNSNWAESKEDYRIQTPREVYYQSLRNILNYYKEDDLTEGYVGLRPRLFYKNEAIKDFKIIQESNWIHLLGIESPGLTSAPAIAEEVVRLVTK